MKISRLPLKGVRVTALYFDGDERDKIKAHLPGACYRITRVPEGYLLRQSESGPQIVGANSKTKTRFRVIQSVRAAEREEAIHKTPLFNAVAVREWGWDPEKQAFLLPIAFDALPPYTQSGAFGSPKPRTKEQELTMPRLYDRGEAEPEASTKSLVEEANHHPLHDIEALVTTINGLKARLGLDLDLRVDKDGFLEAYVIHRIGR